MQVPSVRQNAANSRESANDSIPGVLRVVYCLLGSGLIGLLIVARTLSPDPDGYGTHQQLGLPPCGFKLALGVPCPSCGMTTSWALATRGRLIASARSNAGGLLLAIVAIPAALWLLSAGWCGYWYPWRPDLWMIAGPLAAVILATAVQWVFRVWI